MQILQKGVGLTLAMPSPSSSLGSKIAAITGVLSTAQLVSIKRTQALVLEGLQKREISVEERHREAISADAIMTAEVSNKIEKLNYEMNESLSVIEIKLSSLSKSQWAVLKHLEDKQKKIQFEGEMFFLIDNMKDQLEFLDEISSSFPKYTMVRLNALEDIRRRYKLDISRFKDMEMGKYDRAKEVLSKLGDLLYALKQSTTNSEVKLLDKAIADNISIHQQILDVKLLLRKQRKEVKKQNTMLDSTREIIIQKPSLGVISEIGEMIFSMEKEKKELHANLSQMNNHKASNKLALSLEKSKKSENKLTQLKEKMVAHIRIKPGLFSWFGAVKQWNRTHSKLIDQSLESERLRDLRYSEFKIQAKLEGFLANSYSTYTESPETSKMFNEWRDRINVLETKIKNKKAKKDTIEVDNKRKLAVYKNKLGSHNKKVISRTENTEKANRKLVKLEDKLKQLKNEAVLLLEPYMSMLPSSILV